MTRVATGKGTMTDIRTEEGTPDIEVPSWVAGIVLALLLILSGVAGYLTRVWTAPPPVQASQDAATIYADPDACTADYRGGAWHICDATYPAATKEEFTVTYRAGAWHIVLNEGR